MSILLNTDITVAILAGGRSRRMGQHKGLLQYREQTLIQHLVDSLRPLVKEIVIAGCPETSLYTHLGYPVLDDVITNAGPLGGLYSALHYSQTPLLLTVPCDGIALPPDFVSRLLTVLETGNHNLVYACDSAREQPLYLLIKNELQHSLQRYLLQGHRKVIDWVQAQDYAVVDFSANGFLFSNLNTPDDWQYFLSQHE